MPDVLTKKQRSYCMSQIKGKNTKPEIALRKALWSLGYRYRLKSKLPGRPDIVFPGPKVAVFVDGCFWHKCPEHYQAPKHNAGFWEQKISETVARDLQVTEQLTSEGWTVVRIWEHQVETDLDSVVQEIEAVLK